MKDKVGIVAQAQTKYMAAREEFSISEFVTEVVEKLLKETGLKFEAQDGNHKGPTIDKIVSCSEDYWQGRTISDCFYHLEMGALGMSVTKVAGDGASAFYHGVVNILSGKSKVVMLVSWRKESETVGSIIENAGLDPIYLRPLGLDFLAVSAMQANQYMQKYGITEEQCAEVVVKNRGNAFNNPYAQEALKLTVDDVMNSEMLSSPIRALDRKPVSDGACAMILAGEDIAKDLTNNPVWVAGMANCYDSHYPGDRDLFECKSLQIAAQKAYEMAGITNPREEIDLAEISEEFSYQEPLWMEGLGLCKRGEGGSLIQDGITSIGGDLPVNSSGGLLSGNPSQVAGMIRVAEAYLQLSGQAEQRQIAGAEKALAHGCYGAGGQSHCVVILNR